MKKNLLLLSTLILALMLLTGCDGSGQSQGSSSRSTAIDGTYRYSDGSFEIHIRITGNSYSGSHRVITGLGSSYDPTERYFGSVKGNELYDGQYGVHMGTVSGNTLRFVAPGGRTISLRKQ